MTTLIAKDRYSAFFNAIFSDNNKKKILVVSLLIAMSFMLHLSTGINKQLSEQYFIGWSLVAVLMVFKRIDKFKKPPLRILFILISTFITLRYWMWRTSETLIWTDTLDFIGMTALYLAELYAIAIHFMGIFTNIWPLENKAASLPEDLSLYPTVDVLIPTYNESEDIVKITAAAAVNIDYPKDKLNIYILDDGSTVAKRNNPNSAQAAWDRHYTLRRIAKELGVNYLTRETNARAKAGNQNHGIRHSSSDLLLTLDCDHVPTKDILKTMVGWFIKDEKLALVQTPHFFINQSPLEKNISVMQDAPGENEMFYRSIHTGLDFWNSSFFCGSAALLRRKYLIEVGGISGETITEDCETAFFLHKKGHNSVFLNRPLVCGLSPETFDDLILQRSRWAQGMTQILFLNNPLFTIGLKWYQRLCYFNNCFFWLFGVSRFLFTIAPALFLLLGMKIYFASVTQVIAYALPHIIGSMMLMDFMYGKYRWPFFSELFENIQSLFLMPVAFSVMLNPRKPSFKVTPKGKGVEEDYLSAMALPFLVMCMILILVLPVAVIKWFRYPLYRDVILITIAWCTYNLSLAMASFGVFLEKKQIRRYHRLWAKGKALVFFTRLKETIEADIKDISLSGLGFTFKLNSILMPKEHITLETRDSYGKKFNIEAHITKIIKHDDAYTCGCEFISSNTTPFSTLVSFVYGDSQRWVNFGERQKKSPNPMKLFYLIIKMMLNGTKIIFVAIFQFIFRPIKIYIQRLFSGRQKIQVSDEG
jgi:cellulose synthase (UDP-forming)